MLAFHPWRPTASDEEYFRMCELRSPELLLIFPSASTTVTPNPPCENASGEFMIRKYLNLAFLAALVLCLPSCGHNQQLVSISIQPAAETFEGPDPSVNVQLRALGSYIHPPVTKDITDKVIWASNTPNLAAVTSQGLLSPAGIYVCGGGLISATVNTNTSIGNISSSGAIVTGYMNVTVNNLVVKGCPGFEGTTPTLTVTFLGSGNGTVSSSPAGINCTASCSGSFTSGNTVMLTAAPTGASTFGGWTGCDSVSGSICTVNNLTADRGVSATFN
jgi:Divergent InlB B-repeat domain